MLFFVQQLWKIDSFINPSRPDYFRPGPVCCDDTNLWANQGQPNQSMSATQPISMTLGNRPKPMRGEL